MEKEKIIKTIKSEIKDATNLSFMAWTIIALLGISAAIYLGGGLIFAIPSVLVGTLGHTISARISTKKLRKELSEIIDKPEIKTEVNPQLNSKEKTLDEPSVVVEKTVVNPSISVPYRNESNLLHDESKKEDTDLGKSR